MVPDLLDDQQITVMRAELERLLGEPLERRHPRDKPASGTRHLEGLDSRSGAVAAVLADARLLAAVANWLPNHGGPDQVSYRSPQSGFGRQFLHADDAPRLSAGPPTVATAIIALVDFTSDNGATRLVPGSHERPDLQRASGRLERHPDEQLVLVDAGSAIVFNGHVLHSGTRNDSPRERPALQVVWR